MIVDPKNAFVASCPPELRNESAGGRRPFLRADFRQFAISDAGAGIVARRRSEERRGFSDELPSGVEQEYFGADLVDDHEGKVAIVTGRDDPVGDPCNVGRRSVRCQSSSGASGIGRIRPG